jgi:SAM-dependent methyltransferase
LPDRIAVTYEEAIAAAPAGWSMFGLEDVGRLPVAIRRRALGGVPAGEMAAAAAGDAHAGERVRRALFWTLVYQLRPERWDALAAAEPVHPRALKLLHDLGADRGNVLEIGAGSGRLTMSLVEWSRTVVAIDPSVPLLRILASRNRLALPAAGLAEALPVGDGWADATVSCSSLGIDALVIAEAERVTRAGGLIVLVSPEPGDRRGWSEARFDPEEVYLPPRDGWIDEMFGPPHPPSEVVWKAR